MNDSLMTNCDNKRLHLSGLFSKLAARKRTNLRSQTASRLALALRRIDARQRCNKNPESPDDHEGGLGSYS